MISIIRNFPIARLTSDFMSLITSIFFGNATCSYYELMLYLGYGEKARVQAGGAVCRTGAASG